MARLALAAGELDQARELRVASGAVRVAPAAMALADERLENGERDGVREYLEYCQRALHDPLLDT
jgi:hypothetical protein